VSRAVAATRSPAASAAWANERPKPRDAPVMNQVRLDMPLPYPDRGRRTSLPADMETTGIGRLAGGELFVADDHTDRQNPDMG
jgi:hypothetical protein